MRRPALKTATVLGMTGQGETIAAAKDDAAAQIERILEADKHYPEITAFRGHAALVFASSGHWLYKLICEPGQPLKAGTVQPTTFAHWSRLEAIAYARSHMAQIAWTPAEIDDVAYAAAAFPHGVPGTMGDRLAADLLSWCRWQRGYAAAIAAGADPNHAHEIASGVRPMPAKAAA